MALRLAQHSYFCHMLYHIDTPHTPHTPAHIPHTPANTAKMILEVPAAWHKAWGARGVVGVANMRAPAAARRSGSDGSIVRVKELVEEGVNVCVVEDWLLAT